MFPPASSPKRNRKSNSSPAHSGKAAATFALAVAFLCGMVWDDIENRYASIAVGQLDLDSDTVVLSVADADARNDEVQTALPVNTGAQPGAAKICPLADDISLSLLESQENGDATLPSSIARQTENRMPNAAGLVLASSYSGEEFVSYARRNLIPTFAPEYHSIRKAIAMMALARIQDEAALAGTTIVGTVSTYNPFRDDGKQEGDPETASGELYDPDAWAAAVQTDLRSQFGGIRYGELYRPAYALVESGNRQVIVKVNDVGRLKPGRVLDLNERAMRYFDPFLTRGLLADVKILLLPGEDWIPGPVGSAAVTVFAADEWRTRSAELGPIPSQADTDLPPLRSSIGPVLASAAP
jgi:peptidoglycan lytic transglycosylase